MDIAEATGDERRLEGRVDRLGRLYSEHAPSGLRLAYLLTGDLQVAEDLVQDAFVRIVGRFGHLRIRRSFSAYLNRTIVNLAKDRGRRTELERRHLAASAGSEELSVAPADLALRHELLAALQTLPHRQRAAVVLRYYEDLSEQQVAATLDLSLPAAKSLISRGMESLRQNIGGSRDE